MYKQVNARKYCKAITILFILWPLVLMGIYWPVAAGIRRSVYGMSEPVSASFNWKAMRVESTVWPSAPMGIYWPVAAGIRRSVYGMLHQESVEKHYSEVESTQLPSPRET